MASQFIKVYPEYLKYTIYLTYAEQAVLYGFMYKILTKVVLSNPIELNYKECLMYAKNYLSDEQLKKFNVNRYSEGIKGLVDRGIISRTELGRCVYNINPKLFRTGK